MQIPETDDEFTPLAAEALREACRKARLSTSGEAGVLRARLREGEMSARRSHFRNELLEAAMVDATALGAKTLERRVDVAVEYEEVEKFQDEVDAARVAFFNGADIALEDGDRNWSEEHWKMDGSGSIYTSVATASCCHGCHSCTVTVSRQKVRTSLAKEESEKESEEEE